MPKVGFRHSPESIEKMRISKSGVNNPNYGKPRPLTARQKTSQTLKGHPISEETRKKIKSTIAKQIPELSTKLKSAWADPVIRERRLSQMHTDDYRSKISKTTKERWINPEYRARLSGENALTWRGGVSFEPYCVLFNEEFKNRVRAYFSYQCVECGTPQSNIKLGVHHVNFNKQSCCDDAAIPLFVPLCQSCHGKTQKNRSQWEDYFTELINGYYGGKCYLTKSEFAEVSYAPL